MKRTISVFVLIFAAAMLLAGCKKEPLPTVYTVYSYGAPYTIDTQSRTISDGNVHLRLRIRRVRQQRELHLSRRERIQRGHTVC